MNHKLLVLACTLVSAVVIAGCKPQPPAEPAAPAAAAPAVAPAPMAATGDAPALDPKGFAGTFAGGDSTIALAADGGFDLTQGTTAFDGTWTAESDGARIRLDPNSKAEPDRLYAVVDQDEIRLLDADGQPIEAAVALQREDAGH